jgi:hypothetical protein
MLHVYSGPITSYMQPAIAVRDALSAKAIEFSIGGNGTSWRFDYQKTSGGVGLNAYASDTSMTDAGMPPATEPIWTRLTYNGTSFIWSYSRDGEHFVTAFTISATDYLVNISTVGPALMFAQPSNTSWPAFMHVLSWSVVGI